MPHHFTKVVAFIAINLATTANAYILIDNFQTTEDVNHYPLTVSSDPSTRGNIVDSFGEIDGVAVTRDIQYFISPAGPDTTASQTVSVGNDYLRTESIDGIPFFAIWWRTGVPGGKLRINASREAGLRIRYQTNNSVDVVIHLTETDGGYRSTSGSIGFFTLQDNRSELFFPFESFSHPASYIPPRGPDVLLPPINTASIDAIHFFVADSEELGTSVPKSLDLKLFEFALIPEPAASITMMLGALAVARRRRHA
ncbi:MAG: PEP-CTERM sorting domain-containing protein [Planctomycetota bacterium]